MQKRGAKKGRATLCIGGEPHEIARVVVFLASDDAGFSTGSTISANGGQTMI